MLIKGLDDLQYEKTTLFQWFSWALTGCRINVIFEKVEWPIELLFHSI